jgi:hypothetical protein
MIFTRSSQKKKKQIAEYRHLRKSVHQLPDFYFQDISLSWTWHNQMVPEDEATQRKYEEVEKKVTAVFSTY